MNKKIKVLVVDDEKQLVSLVSHHMDMADYDVLRAFDGELALRIAKEKKPDIIILDLMLPKKDGLEVCRAIREDPDIKDIPIIMLTAKSTTEDVLKGFELGADDYVVKPFSPRELVARVKRVLQRSDKTFVKPTKVTSGDVEVSLEDFSVKVKNKEIDLTEKEKEILAFLVNKQNEVVHQDVLLDEIWYEDEFVERNNIDVHLRHLREKLEDDPSNPKIIKTVKGVGYKFITG